MIKHKAAGALRRGRGEVRNMFAEVINNLTVVSVILFAVGIIMTGIEIFRPGFGAAGISGIVLLAAGILVTAKDFRQGLILLAAVAVAVLILFVIAVTVMSGGRLPKKSVLKEETDSGSGYVAVRDSSDLMGRCGRAVTMLRPAGMADICGQRVDVVSRGDFIEQGAEVEVVEISGSRIVVKNKEDQ